MSQELKDFRCREKDCRVVIGLSDGEWFVAALPHGFTGYVAPVSATRLDVICPVCRRISHWHKAKPDGSKRIQKLPE